MSHLDPEDDQALADLIVKNQSAVTNALNVFANRMAEAARDARDSYEKCMADPELRASQNKSIITTEALRMSAQMFTDNADQARMIARRIDQIIDGDDDE